MRVKEESERADFKLNIKKVKIMASGPITSWQIERENVEVVVDFLFLGSKITVDSYCSREIRRQVLLGRKVMTNLECVEKQRHFSASKDLYSHGYGLPSGHVWLWKLDSKESRTQNNWCRMQNKWCWRRLLKVAWTAKRSNQSILEDINPEYSLEWLMLKLKLQYFGNLMWTAN